MPRVGGDEVLEELRRIKSDARVVLMSGYTEQRAKARLGDDSLAGFLQKPFSSEDLVFNGFAGIDVVLPIRYQLSAEVRGKGRDEISFTLGLSQRSR